MERPGFVYPPPSTDYLDLPAMLGHPDLGPVLMGWLSNDVRAATALRGTCRAARAAVPKAPRGCARCHVPLVATSRFKCWACVTFGNNRKSRTYCGACAPLASCTGDCTTPHRLCARHMHPPAAGYDRPTWLAEHGYEEEDEPDCINCLDDLDERRGCAVCDGTGYQYLGKGGGHEPGVYHYSIHDGLSW
jgi:hypothetical protein